ncbi:MAG TPA: hypothetical protein VMK12_27225 [Anaeromyxobacteraceae bacterium]|nr:hypothetical protein [Anaeromyxobacteraceae bacterium]
MPDVGPYCSRCGGSLWSDEDLLEVIEQALADVVEGEDIRNRMNAALLLVSDALACRLSMCVPGFGKRKA